MATTARLLTYDDLLELPDDGTRYEIIDGVLVEMPSPIAKHQEVVFRLALWIGNFLAATTSSSRTSSSFSCIALAWSHPIPSRVRQT
jgi:Uma2 family endonuclease